MLVHRIPYDKSIAQHVGSQMVNPLVAAEQGYAVVVGNHGHAVRGVCDLSQSCHRPVAPPRQSGQQCIGQNILVDLFCLFLWGRPALPC